MEFSKVFEIVFKIYYPLFIILFGLIGNLIVFLIFSNKHMINLNIRNFFVLISITNSLGLIQFLQKFLIHAFDLNIRIFSTFHCQFFGFLAYVFGPMSAWILVYISIERYFSIFNNSMYFIFKNQNFQYFIIFSIVFYNIFFYMQIFFLNDLYISLNGNLSEISCESFMNEVFNDIFYYIDLFNSTLMPFIFMVLTSFLLVCKIYKSRSKFQSKSKNNIKQKKDIKFAISSITLNLIFLFFNLPMCIYQILPVSKVLSAYVIFNNLFYTSFSTQFIILFLTNSLFRKQFMKLLRIKDKSNQITAIEMTTRQTNKLN